MPDSGCKVLAIALDALPGALVGELMQSGDMPFLRSLYEQGASAGVLSTNRVGSGSVWPTFFSGLPPESHGICGEWGWEPESMGVRRYAADHLTPFWAGPEASGLSVGLLEVPFGPASRAKRGFSIKEWGAQEVLTGRMDVSPPEVEALVRACPQHPYHGGPPRLRELDDVDAFDDVCRKSLHGIAVRGEVTARLIEETRPALAIVNFSELHHAGHYAWHTVEPDHWLYAGRDLPQPTGPWSFIDMCKAVDVQLRRLSSLVADDGTMFVFSLHGMRPSFRLPTLLSPMLRTFGFASVPTWRTMSWTGRGGEALKRAKALAPHSVKELYHRRTPFPTQVRVAQASILDRHDWKRTEAVALPSDAHGWVRVNLRGRERLGTVEPARYDEVCAGIEDVARRLRDDEGRPLVDEVIRPAAESGVDPASLPVPDVIVNWADAAMDEPLAISELPSHQPGVGVRTGRHSGDGFCVAAGDAPVLEDPVPIGRLHLHMLDALGLPPEPVTR